MYLPLLSTTNGKPQTLNGNHPSGSGSESKHGLQSTPAPSADLIYNTASAAQAVHYQPKRVVWQPIACGDLVVYVRRALAF